MHRLVSSRTSEQSLRGKTLVKTFFNVDIFFKCINTYISKLLDKSSSTLLTFGLKIKEWMKQFHRILEKELVFFLKKTTNFCTATIFDIHLIKKKKKRRRRKSTEKHNIVHMWLPTQVWATEKRMSKQKMGKSLLYFWTLLAIYTLKQYWWGEQGNRFHTVIFHQCIMSFKKKKKSFCVLTTPQQSLWAKDLLIRLPLKS